MIQYCNYIPNLALQTPYSVLHCKYNKLVDHTAFYTLQYCKYYGATKQQSFTQITNSVLLDINLNQVNVDIFTVCGWCISTDAYFNIVGSCRRKCTAKVWWIVELTATAGRWASLSIP